MYLPLCFPRCRWVCFFIWTDLKKWSITSLAHQWMGAIRMSPNSWYKHHNNPHIFCPMPWEVKSCMFVRNKSLINTLSIIHWFQLKYKSSIHNIVFSIDKVVLSESGEKLAQIKHLLQVKTVQNWSGVDYCDAFISCLDSHSDGTHSLQRIRCWTSDVMLHFSKSALMKKQTHLHFEWLEGE